MNLRSTKKRWVLTAILTTLFAGVTPLLADEMVDGTAPSDFIHQRNYVGFMAVYAGIDKNQDFNGLNQVTNSVSSSLIEADGIPSFDAGYGFGLLLGHREGSYAGELSFLQSYHTASWTGGSAFTGQNTAIYHLVNFDLKRYFFEKFPAQPFVTLGINYSWIDVQSASALVNTSSGSTVAEGNLTIDGLGFNLGAGLEIYLGEGFSLVGGAYERFTGYSGLVGVERQSEKIITTLSPGLGLNSTGLNFVLGTTIAIE